MSPKPNSEPHFKAGSKIEISPEEDGFRDSFFTGTLIRRANKDEPGKFLVEYDNLYIDDAGTKPLREVIGAFQLRPIPPREADREFKVDEEVDAYHSDGWWEGMIMEDLGNGRFSVFFRATKEQLEFEKGDLRLHREWMHGEWVPPLEGAQEEEGQVAAEVEPVKATPGKGKSKKATPEKGKSKRATPETGKSKRATPETGKSKRATPETGKSKRATPETGKSKRATPETGKSNKATPETGKSNKAMPENFQEGTLVEVTSDEEGFLGAWFTATVVKPSKRNKFLIEYHTLRTEDDTEFLKEEIDHLHIRPHPPETSVVDQFKLLDEVDASYNDGWWVGVISKVLGDSRYIVYFKNTNEEIEFGHSDLRPHQEWIDGKWVETSKVIEF